MRPNPTPFDVGTTAAGRDRVPPRMLAAATACWAVDALMLGLLTWGAGVPAQAAFWTLTIGGMLTAAGFGLAFALRWNRHARDRYLTLPQLFGASSVVLLAAGDRAHNARRRAEFGVPHFLAANITTFADLWSRCVGCR
jgi:hypothetical protein